MLACSHATIFPHTQTHETCVLKHGEAVEAGVVSDLFHNLFLLF